MKIKKLMSTLTVYFNCDIFNKVAAEIYIENKLGLNIKKWQIRKDEKVVIIDVPLREREYWKKEIIEYSMVESVLIVV